MDQNLSITGKVWKLREVETGAGAMLSRDLGISPVTGRILASRGFSDPAVALSFLTPRLTDLPDPLHLKDMDKAVERLVTALQNNEKIAIFGDYDVDGGCATALLIRYFRSVGTEALIYIPDRMTEGYGPNPQAMEEIKKMGADLVITVDCGSVAFEPMARAKELGLDVIITDHHQTMPERPECVALVNPNRVDENSNCTMLSGAGVAFYMALALTRKLREIKFFSAERPEPDNRFLLDLVAVSTVCDMVPVLGPNRVLVGQGLKAMSTRRNFGLAALADVAGVNEKPNTYHAGFMIGPRINAGGRIADCDLGAKLLSTQSPDEAKDIATRLNLVNEERKNIEAEVLTDAMAEAEKCDAQGDKVIMVAGAGWHEGVIGIVASRIKEKFHKPAIVIAINGDEAKGSGRSVSGINLGKAIIDNKDLLIKGGGHAMAAGLSVETTKIDDLRHALCLHVEKQAQQILDEQGRDVFLPRLTLDDFVSVEGATEELMKELDKLEPYGAGHSEPKFVLSGVRVDFAKSIGAEGNHLTFSVSSGGPTKLKGIAFRAMESDIGPFMLQAWKDKSTVSICGTLRRNVWQGRSTIQLQLTDVYNGVWSAE